MLSEIDVFVELLNNDRDIDIVLSYLNEKVNSNNILLKKIRLKKKLKNPQGIRKSKKIITFYNIIIKTTNPLKNIVEKFTKMELINYFNTLENNIPDFVKYCTILRWYPDLIKGNLQLILDNNKNKVPIFSNILKIETKEEVEAYLINNTKNIINLKNEIIKKIETNLDENELILLKNAKKIIKDWSLVDYFQKYIELLNTYPKYLIDLAYIKENNNKWDIEIGIIINILMEMIKIKQNIIPKDVRNILEKNNKLIYGYKVVNKNLKNKLLSEKVFNKKLQKQNNNLNKEIEVIKKQNNNNNNMIKRYKEDNKKNIIYLEELKKNLDIKTKDFELKIKNLKLYNKRLVNEIKEININHPESYRSCSAEKKCYKYCIVHKSDLKICKELFDEVLFLKFNECIYEKLKLVKNVSQIYIQRNGISSDQILLLEKIAKQNKIESKILVFSDNRQATEIILENLKGE